MKSYNAGSVSLADAFVEGKAPDEPAASGVILIAMKNPGGDL
jgi:hypothetical protein